MTRRELFHTFLMASAGALVACKGATVPTPTPTPDPQTVTDADGNVYRTVRIGTQVWMAENLKATRGVPGAGLPNVYAYGDLDSNVATYGRIYGWNTAMMPLIAGWHLPSAAEWSTLIDAVGTANAAAALRQGGSSQFNALLGGIRQYDGTYVGLGAMGEYWSSTGFNGDHAYTVTFWPNQPQVERTGFGVIGAMSVRLVKDN